MFNLLDYISKLIRAKVNMATKYPRTLHLPDSPGATSDDKRLTFNPFEGKEVVITAKMDGENTTMYTNGLHARSIDSPYHKSRTFVSRLHSLFSFDIPTNMRICGENLYAKHSIYYKNLIAYFQVFNIWEDDECLSWDDVVTWCNYFGLPTVPVLYEGIWDNSFQPLHIVNGDLCEGYVVRLREAFFMDEFSTSVGKYVRANHVTTHAHWMNELLVPNLRRLPIDPELLEALLT